MRTTKFKAIQLAKEWMQQQNPGGRIIDYGPYFFINNYKVRYIGYTNDQGNIMVKEVEMNLDETFRQELSPYATASNSHTLSEINMGIFEVKEAIRKAHFKAITPDPHFYNCLKELYQKQKQLIKEEQNTLYSLQTETYHYKGGLAQKVTWDIWGIFTDPGRANEEAEIQSLLTDCNNVWVIPCKLNEYKQL